jgi:hypothetical protein
MDDRLSIKRRKSRDNELSFDSLRSEAIKLLQQVSGETWTDYNLHDPGITILEQLIYALTDLIYRSDFDVGDYLADAEGNIKLDALNLIKPEQILSCRPTTTLDYRKLMLNKMTEVDNVWLTAKDNSSNCRGLYRLLVKLEQGLDERRQNDAKEQLYEIFHAARNLCEDLDPADIKVVTNLGFELHAKIEVDSAQPAKRLAEIYFKCARRMASSVSITDFDQPAAGPKRPLDQLFDGPLTSHGFSMDDDSRQPRSEFLVSKLFATINKIQDVDHIEELFLQKDGKKYDVKINTDDPGQAFDLKIPWPDADIKVVLTKNGRELPIPVEQVRAHYDEISFKYHQWRLTRQDLSLLTKPIIPRFEPFDRYFSIQNHFPDSYGVNQQGVPASAKPEEKAQARQLKGYLLIFEQLMANYLANIDALKTLFSTRAGADTTYAVQALDPQQIADLKAVYPKDPGQVFRGIMGRFDNYNERKSRLLDYLLAMYGESFTQNSLRHFNYYYGKDEIEKVIVKNKIDYLESIVKLGRDPAAAPDYNATGNGDRRGGLSIRAAILLGFERRQANSLTDAMREHGFEELIAGSGELRPGSSAERAESGYDHLKPPPLEPLEKSVTVEELRANIADIIPLEDKSLSGLLLTNGIYINRYRIGSAGQGRVQLFLIDEGEQWWQLADFTEESSAIEAVNSLRKLLLAVNRDSEGLHIVEHLLLRPQVSAMMSHTEQVDDFYSFKISVIFPNWTARCCQPEFQNLAEETLRLNSPAHILAEYCWLNYADMNEFEGLYDAWCKLKNSRNPAPADLDYSAAQLKEFLLAHHEKRQTEQ